MNQKKVTAKIRTVLFKIDKIRFNKRTGRKVLLKNKDILVRLTLYSRKPSSIFPDKSIAKESLTKILKHNQKIVSFDISDWDMIFRKEGIFVDIEFLGHYDAGAFIPFDKKKDTEDQFTPSFSIHHNTQQSFIRWNYGEDWKSASHSSAAYNNSFCNFNFGIEVEY